MQATPTRTGGLSVVNEVPICVVLLVLIGLALLIPSAVVLAVTLKQPYAHQALYFSLFSSTYVASALLALASIPLLVKRLIAGAVLGVLACLASFTCFLLLATLQALGILGYPLMGAVMLLIGIGVILLAPEFLAIVLLAKAWNGLKRG